MIAQKIVFTRNYLAKQGTEPLSEEKNSYEECHVEPEIRRTIVVPVRNTGQQIRFQMQLVGFGNPPIMQANLSGPSGNRL